MNVQSTAEASTAPAAEAAEPTAEQATPVDATTADQAASQDAPSQPAGTSETPDDQSFLERFRLEDIEKPEVRDEVARWVKQAQGDYTRKTMSLAEQRRTVEAEAARVADIRETFDRLEDDETRDSAIQALVTKYGYTFEEAEAEADAASDEAEREDGAEFRDPRVDALIAEREAARQAEAAQNAALEAEAHNDKILDHVDEALDKYVETSELGELRPGQRRQIIAIAASLPRLDGDLPDMDTAIAEYEAERAADLEAYLASKRGAVPDVTGATGTEQFDPRDTKQRLAAANRIAEAALARHR